jgi:hypothetical protein
MFNYGYDYQRYLYFKNNFTVLSKDIIIKLTPYESLYDDVKYIFDKRIVLIREDLKSQAESRVFSEKFGKKFSSYSIPNNFLNEFKSEIIDMYSIIELENEKLKQIEDCLILTYEELYQSDIGVFKLENYFNTKFKYGLEYKRYRNMNQSLI